MGLLQTLAFRPPRRIRLFFTDTLSTSAFQSTSFYAVSNVDGKGASPTNVVAVFALTSSPSIVELAIDNDLAGGGLYEIDCTAVPFQSSSSFTGSLQGTVPLPLAAPVNVEPAVSDFELLLYGRDILYDGNDFVLDSTGDLATVSGQDNYRGAIRRRMLSAGLLWDPAYGANAPSYVNAPDALRASFAGNLLAQARADDRTLSASVDVAQDTTDPERSSWFFEVTIVGRDKLDPFSVSVPLPLQVAPKTL